MQVLRTTGNRLVSIDEIDQPTPSVDEVTIDVEAASVNPIDVMVVDGQLHALDVIEHQRPVGLGWDAVGRSSTDPESLVAVVRAGADVAAGALAQRLIVPAHHVAVVPDGLSPVAAASIGMNALTAYQALSLAGEAEGRSLLVTGAAGAVGGFAIELASAAGWQVTGLARASDEQFVTAAGAELITELPDRGTAAAPTYDVVFDAAPLQLDADAFAAQVAPAVAPGGTFIGVLGLFPQPELPGRKVVTVMVEPDGKALAWLLNAAARGAITPRTAGTVTLADAQFAVDQVREGGQRGRWIVTTTS